MKLNALKYCHLKKLHHQGRATTAQKDLSPEKGTVPTSTHKRTTSPRRTSAQKKELLPHLQEGHTTQKGCHPEN